MTRLPAWLLVVLVSIAVAFIAAVGADVGAGVVGVDGAAVATSVTLTRRFLGMALSSDVLSPLLLLLLQLAPLGSCGSWWWC